MAFMAPEVGAFVGFGDPTGKYQSLHISLSITRGLSGGWIQTMSYGVGLFVGLENQPSKSSW